MGQSISKVGMIRWGVGFFVSGSLIHFFLQVGIYAGETFVGRTFMNIAVSALGGSFVCFLMLKFLRTTLLRSSVRTVSTIARGSAWGLAATFLTFESFYVLESVYLTLSPSGPVHSGGLSAVIPGFVVLFIGIQSYGVETIIRSLPFAFLYGILAGIVVQLACRKRQVFESSSAER